MKLGLTFIAALLAKSATPSLAKGTRRVAAAAEEAAPAVAGVDQPDVAALSGFGEALSQLVMELDTIQTHWYVCIAAAGGDSAGLSDAGICNLAAFIGVQQAFLGIFR